MPSGLGYAPPGYSGALEALGVPEALQVRSGLVDSKGEPFAQRVTFPWLSIAGTRVLGIGGRKFTSMDPRPKYANVPESPWFAKSRAVFGLAQAAKAVHGSGWALITEGPFDALALWDLGWTNAVATVGAKVTLDQLLHVVRLCDRVVVMLDNDEGGRRGQEALRSVRWSHLIPSTVTVYVATLRSNDPAEAERDEIHESVQAALPI